MAEGWGETPLAVEWGWPSQLTYDARNRSMCRLRERLAAAWVELPSWGHPIELGHKFLESVLPNLVERHNLASALPEPLPR